MSRRHTNESGTPAVSAALSAALSCDAPVQIQLLGEVAVFLGAQLRPMPKSRKARSLLAYLALTAREHHRDHLCRMFWDQPGDPRAGLRWTLTKLRPLLDLGSKALLTEGECVRIGPTRVVVDILEIRKALEKGNLDDSALMDIEARLATGALLGLDDAGNTEFQLWLDSEREAVRAIHGRVLCTLTSALPPEQALPWARKRAALNPLDTPANVDLLRLTQQVSGITSARAALDRMRVHYRGERASDGKLLAAWQSMFTSSQSPSQVSTSIINEPTGVNLDLPDKPSLAVLGFRDLTSGEHCDVLARGLGVDLTSRLSRLPQIFVTARASASQVASLGLSPADASRLLGVRYLIEGTSQCVGRRVRITISLLDGTNNSELWSERFDRALDDILGVQDEVTGTIVATIEPAIQRAEMQRALLTSPNDFTAWQCYHRGMWHGYRFTKPDIEVAGALLQRAVSIDPRFSRAYAGLSFIHYSRAILNTDVSFSEELDNAIAQAQRSVELDERDAMGHWCLGRALYLLREHAQALASIERSLDANPNFAQGFYAKGFIGTHAGLDESSIVSLDQAQRLSPYDPLLFAMKGARALALANQGKYGEAESWAMRAALDPNAHIHVHAIKCACQKLAGHTADASRTAHWVLKHHPDYTVEQFQQSFPHQNEVHREATLAAMNAGGIPRKAS